MSYGRPDHKPTTTPNGVCQKCDLPASLHRERAPKSPAYITQYYRENPRENPSEHILGIDGEGIGRGPHRYFYLAAADDRGNKWSVGDPDHLSTAACLDFILGLPRRTLIFAYGFLYDLTKLLQDLPDDSLYRLFHEETRLRLVTHPKTGKRSTRLRPERWGPYRLNYMNRRFSIAHSVTKRSATVWDIFRFFQGKFTKALIDWEVASKERLRDMERMKELRATWNGQTREAIEEYCDEECLYLSKLGKQLLTTHTDCGLKLPHYFGAGSTATALLRRMDVLRYRGIPPEEMREAIACAFFGGRFENSIVGPVTGTVYNYDISSAYPYQATLLPCLDCGHWKHVKSQSQIIDSRLACVSWTIGAIVPNAWGTLPVRSKDGTIAFPLSGVGGWVWKEEFLAAQRYNPAVRMREAWVYHTDCDHRPFYELGAIYRERVRIGSDARGIVLKLGPNSVYGKVAQSRGGIEPPFQSWIWAGNITSGCRAQLLEGLHAAKDPWNVLMFATDGIWTRERLDLPKPRETGTGDLPKPLGGWEEKTFKSGVFAVRPGIYFPLSPTEEQLKEVRARGLGKKVLYEQWPKIIDAWKHPGKSNCPTACKTTGHHVHVGGVERFIGAKTGISYAPVAKKYHRSKYYGEWVAYPIQVTFHPAPKRQVILKGGLLAPWDRLPESVPYRAANVSVETIALRWAELVAEEQPNADFSDLDTADQE